MKKILIALSVVIVIVAGFYVYKFVVIRNQQSKINSQTNVDSVAISNFLKTNGLQAAIVQRVSVSNKSSVSLIKSDGTSQNLFNWTDNGSFRCGISLISDCSNRQSLRAIFTQSTLPVYVSPSINNSVIYYTDETKDISQGAAPYFDLSKYLNIDTNKVHLVDHSEFLSPNGEYIFGYAMANLVHKNYPNAMALLKINDISQDAYGINGDDLTLVLPMPNIVVTSAVWTADSRYLIYEFKNVNSVDKSAPGIINVYNSSTNTQKTLLSSYPITGHITVALNDSSFLVTKADGTYLDIVNEGVISESKLVSSETRIIGVVH